MKAKILRTFLDVETKDKREEGKEAEFSEQRLKQLEKLGFAKRIESKMKKKDLKDD